MTDTVSTHGNEYMSEYKLLFSCAQNLFKQIPNLPSVSASRGACCPPTPRQTPVNSSVPLAFRLEQYFFGVRPLGAVSGACGAAGNNEAPRLRQLI